VPLPGRFYSAAPICVVFLVPPKKREEGEPMAKFNNLSVYKSVLQEGFEIGIKNGIAKIVVRMILVGWKDSKILKAVLHPETIGIIENLRRVLGVPNPDE
jgi:hypothetical protein